MHSYCSRSNCSRSLLSYSLLFACYLSSWANVPPNACLLSTSCSFAQKHILEWTKKQLIDIKYANLINFLFLLSLVLLLPSFPPRALLSYGRRLLLSLSGLERPPHRPLTYRIPLVYRNKPPPTVLVHSMLPLSIVVSYSIPRILSVLDRPPLCAYRIPLQMAVVHLLAIVAALAACAGKQKKASEDAKKKETFSSTKSSKTTTASRASSKSGERDWSLIFDFWLLILDLWSLSWPTTIDDHFESAVGQRTVVSSQLLAQHHLPYTFAVQQAANPGGDSTKKEDKKSSSKTSSTGQKSEFLRL